MIFAEVLGVPNVDDTPTRIRPGTLAQWEKQCPRCGEWVGLGRNGGLHTFLTHQDGQRCFRAAERRAQARSEQTLEFPIASASPEPSTLLPPPVSTPLYVTMPGPPLGDSPRGPPLSYQPASLHSNLPMTTTAPSPPPLSSAPSPILPEQASTTTGVPCFGVRLKWVCEHPARTYPFQYHDTGNPTWFAMAPGPCDPDVIYLRSVSCTIFRDPFAEACSECIEIPSSAKFQSLTQNALKDPAPSTPHMFLSWEQLSHKAKAKADECRQLRKKVCLTSLLQTQH
jgi:hypothetical protein